MDGTVLSLFLVSTFAGGLTSGIAGFAAGLVVSGVWLHILTPAQTAVLIVSYGIVNQSYTVWKLRHAFSWRRVGPFVIGGLVGVPLGTVLLTMIDPSIIRVCIGVLLICFSTYNLARPKIMPVSAGRAIDGGIGVLNGAVGGLTGLGGVVVTVWCQMRDWPKDVQRTVFQPVIAATMAMTAVSLAIGGAYTMPTIKLLFIGLPALLAGLWVGLKLYGRLDDVAFRRIILVLLFFSGLTLVIPTIAKSF
ncbi:MAG: sulfite exporter TauE/SafE family protein [Pseudolabrys sp.]|nr:sulfite exporter TauE/SafE family protein [Pseudolabrys sp.]